MHNYIICATPRSGSNLLCELLSSLGFAGYPDEYLFDPAGTHPEPLATRWPRIRRAGTTPNGVFAIKLMWLHAELLEQQLPAVLGMAGQPLAEVLSAELAKPKYVYITRQNHLRQALSLVRAAQTDQWTSMDRPTDQPYYDASAIKLSIRYVEYYEGRWEEYFAANGIRPYRVTYERLELDPEGVVEGVLGFLGHDAPLEKAFGATKHQRQRDALTELWLERFQREVADPA